jgi:peptidoglycan/LPS O-acetylase OafA/YrhL
MFSYSIYLWHVDLAQAPLIERFHHFVSKDSSAEFQWITATLAYVALAMGTGMFMAKIIEQPALALRSRLFPAGTKQTGTVEFSTAKTVCTGAALAPALERINE